MTLGSGFVDRLLASGLVDGPELSSGPEIVRVAALDATVVVGAPA